MVTDFYFLILVSSVLLYEYTMYLYLFVLFILNLSIKH